MSSQYELDKCYATVALAHAQLSKAKRNKVGACLVTATGVIIPGYNGLSAGGSNIYETREWVETDGAWSPKDGEFVLVSKPEVIHAELNCVLKCAKSGISMQGCSIYVSLSPCLHCSEMLIQAGVKEVVYLEQYRCTKGIDNLLSRGIITRQFIYED